MGNVAIIIISLHWCVRRVEPVRQMLLISYFRHLRPPIFRYDASIHFLHLIFFVPKTLDIEWSSGTFSTNRADRCPVQIKTDFSQESIIRVPLYTVYHFSLLQRLATDKYRISRNHTHIYTHIQPD